MVQTLASQGWQVDFWPYDWRFPLIKAAEKLANYLLQKYADGLPFQVLGYSLGGLVARLAYPQFFSPTRTNWTRSVYVGTPHFGSHAAMLQLENPDVPGGLTGFAFEVAAGVGNALLSGRLPKWYKGRLLQVLASWQVLYDLLPSIAGGWADKDPQAALHAFHFEDYNNKDVHQYQFNRALATRTAIDNTLTNHPAETCVVGSGVATPTRLLPAQEPDLGSEDSYDRTDEGDGVVTVERGTLPNAKSLILIGVQHYQLPESAALLRRLSSLLLEPLPIDEKLKLSTIETPQRIVVPPAEFHEEITFRAMPRRGDP